MKKFIAIISNLFVSVYKWIIAIFWPHILKVDLVLSSDPYFVGSYAKIKVTTQGITFDELNFVIPEGAPAGYISPCIDAEYDPSNPDFMICFGYKPGAYHIEARKKSDGSLIATFNFNLDTIWTDEVNGPSVSFHGVNDGYAVGAAWGGGPANTPQNVNVCPATGTRKVAMILLDTSSQRYTSVVADLQAIRDNWLQNFKDGFLDTDGVTKSARQFYREASFNNFDIDCDLFGPVHLAGNFDSYINAQSAPRLGFAQACITAGDSLIDYNQYQSVIFILQSWNTTDSNGIPIEKAAWPQAWGSTYITAEGFKTLGVLQMPHNWSFKPVYATISHELGHNLGLRDQYDGGGLLRPNQCQDTG